MLFTEPWESARVTGSREGVISVFGAVLNFFFTIQYLLLHRYTRSFNLHTHDFGIVATWSCSCRPGARRADPAASLLVLYSWPIPSRHLHQTQSEYCIPDKPAWFRP
ncbi:hypothetical protein EJ02DRAFT_263894 [Clathrospora elynae]|uniref:Uncharacterized protein n=1 Tax=Clathrospora elynae TaxID=706981 RepID=A0A6A5SIH9_9PLEO|nr:hypothetical protein EJ02DRAFT_263894 [Clathrospora elynae]